MIKTTITSILLIAIWAANVFVYAQYDDAELPSIADYIRAQTEAEEPEFVFWYTMLQKSDLLDFFDDSSIYITIFIPTDKAIETYLENIAISPDEFLLDSSVHYLDYHISLGGYTIEDMANITTVNTFLYQPITINDEQDKIVLNDQTQILEGDIFAQNGVIHIIDTVLVPPTNEVVSTQQALDTCYLSHPDNNKLIGVRVGAGFNRAIRIFLPSDQAFLVLGEAKDTEDNLWYLIDFKAIANLDFVNQAWVLVDEVEIQGICDNLEIVESNPIRLPSMSQIDSTPYPNGEINTSSNLINLPQAGNWTVYWAETTDASCSDAPNIVLVTSQIFDESLNPYYTRVQNVNQTYFEFINMTMEYIGDGVYWGAATIDGITGTVYIDSIVSAHSMYGRFITSYDNCSATVNFEAIKG